MPVPKPNQDESEQDYMERCMTFMADEGTPHEQAIAICMSEWGKKAINASLLPINKDKEYNWDSKEADKRVRDWAGAQDKPNDKYAKAFLYHDAKKAEDFGSYKLPIADVIDGGLQAIFKACASALGALNGARGGVDIPEADKAKAIATLDAYNKKWDEKKDVKLVEKKTVIKHGADDYLKELDNAVKEYQKGKSEKPTLEIEGKVIKTKGEIKMVLSKEIYDRDGEVIDIDGMDIGNYLRNPVLLDAHDIGGSVVNTVLGRVENVSKTVGTDGVKQISGNPVFAPTPNGKIAQALVENDFVKTVSVGFGVDEFDIETKRITKSELYETSLVSVPSNVMATITKGLQKGEKPEEKILVMLDNLAHIKPVIKEYRRFFMGDELMKMLGYTKTGNELIDLKNVYDSMILMATKNAEPEKSSDPAPEPAPQENPEKPAVKVMTRDELFAEIKQAVDEALEK